jgi:predicted TPR repeat methyltransferase
MVSADALVYFGDLSEVLRAASEALRPNGVFVFTLERAVKNAPPIGYRLEVHGRYSHTRSYVNRLLSVPNMLVEIADADLRMEAGVPVQGLVVRARKVRTR